MNVYHEHSSTLVLLQEPINKEVILITLYKIPFSPAVKKDRLARRTNFKYYSTPKWLTLWYHDYDLWNKVIISVLDSAKCELHILSVMILSTL